MYHHRVQERRVNEKDVPESQHALFIRGLPGSVTTSEVKDFFEENVGACSFDFVKVTQDRLKLHIAVRFESKTAAKECMERYNDANILGHRVELSWFRDIRRYLNHTQKQGFPRPPNMRPFRPRFEPGGGRGGRFVPNRRSRSYTKSRSNSRSKSRSVSRSRSGSRSVSHSKTRSPSSSSALSHRSLNSKREGSTNRGRSSSPPPVKKKKVKREKKKKRNRSPLPPNKSISDLDTSEGELPPNGSSEGKLPRDNNVLCPDTSPKRNEADSAQQTPISPSSSVHNSLKSVSPVLKNTTIRLDLGSSNQPAQRIVINRLQSPMSSSVPSKANNCKSSPPRPMAPRNAQPKASSTTSEVKSEWGSSDPLLEDNEIAFSGALTNFKMIQRQILQEVRYTPESTTTEQIGTFRLSSLATKKSNDSLREEKIQNLAAELRQKVERKKLQLELSYRHDCETFGLVTRKLIAKDRSLEERNRLALLEAMKDLETEAIKQLDEYLDQLIFLSS